MRRLSNTPYDQLEIGMSAETTRLCVADDLYVFAHASGNLNPMHLPRYDGDGDGVPEAIAPSMWVGALISSVLGNQLPGPGTLYRSQSFQFLDRAHAGDELRVGVRLVEKLPERVARFETYVARADGTRVVEGVAEVIAPASALSIDIDETPGITVQRHVHFDRLLEEAEPLDPIPTAVAAPETPNALGGALLGAEHTLITPILIGDQAKIEAAARELGKPLGGYEILHEPDHAASAALAVKLAREGRAEALMKGHLHTDTLLGAVVKREGGLRTARRLSHVFVMDVPGLPHLLLVSDAAINIAPDLEAKVDITQNAIDLARALGVEQPKVGVLSAVETVNPKIPSTIDAAVLSKMAERGQIKGGLVDGPLAMDNAMDVEAATTKGIKSLVAGRADILIVPNLEAGNMLAKELIFVAHAEGGGLVLGARKPIILTSRADDDKARLASCAVAALYARWMARGGAGA
ncbi:MAG: bifunctional enoyl-CoA hydratase/phosphate acetyltransferase [Pseudomonadota bacterium]